jgi:hypothetical protein
MTEIRSVWNNSTENVFQHSAVNFTVFSFRGTIAPRDVEDVCDIGENGEFGLCVVWIGDIALDVFDRVIGVP